MSRHRLLAGLGAVLLLGAALALWHLDAQHAFALPPTAIHFSHASGYYDAPLSLELSSRTDVIYTLDGSLPTAEAHLRYDRPLTIERGHVVVVRARTCDDTGRLGAVYTRHYIVALGTELPLFSLAMEPSDLWSEETGIFRHWEESGQEWERLAQVLYVDRGYADGFESVVGVRVHGDWSRQFEKRSLRLYWRRGYGQAGLVYPLFDDSDRRQFDRLVVHCGGEDWHSVPDREWSLICNQLGAELMFQMGGYATHSQPVLLFINGERMGIYYLRERVNERLLAESFGITNPEILRNPQNPLQREVVRGDPAAWEALMSYVATRDLREPEAYAHVARRVDLQNLMDYYILQIYAANNDWPQQNVMIFRDTAGSDWRFKHLLWDIDHAFWIDSDINMNMVQWLYVEHPEVPDMSDTLLIRALLETRAFRETFLARAAYLMNTTLDTENVCALIDSLASRIAPDIAVEEERWGSTRPWTEHLERMRSFARRRPDILRQHMKDWFGLPGTYRLTVLVPAEGEGTVSLDGNPLTADYTGVHFAGVPVGLRAEPQPGYRLIGWEGLNEPTQAHSIHISDPTAETTALRPMFAANGE